MAETDKHGNVFDNPPVGLDTTFMDTPDRVHAKAELALRFLEYTTGGIKQLSEFDEDQKKSIREIELRCWTIISEYFPP